MKLPSRWLRAALTIGLFLLALSAMAAEYPTPREADWIARDFRFHTGEVMPAVRLHYTTIGDPSGELVLVLHGTNNSGATMLTAGFAGELFGDGQALDANDFIWQFDASRDYDPSPGLERIQAIVLAINSADDERNPPETGLFEQAMKRVKNRRLFLIPASAETRGHGTTSMAKFWQVQLREFMNAVPRRAM